MNLSERAKWESLEKLPGINFSVDDYDDWGVIGPAKLDGFKIRKDITLTPF
jgi:hypothetical protein